MTDQQTPSVLVVDDMAADRDLLRRLLRDAYPDCTIAEATGMQDVRALDPEEAFDVVFLDFLMPKIDGLAALSELLELWPYSAYILVTGSGDEETAARAIKLGAADYISKDRLEALSISTIVDYAREKVRLRRALEARLNELTSFANALIHDLRAPLRHARRLYSEAQAAVEAGDHAAAMASLAAGRNECDRLSAILNALIQHVRAGEPSEMEAVDVDRLLSDVQDELAQRIAAADARISHGRLPFVHGDAGQLRILFRSLLENALAYAGEAPPEIAISVTPVERGRLLFTVADRGIGVPEKHLASIFDPFRRLHSNDEIPGSGLGLSSCRTVVRRHGGEIWCDSRPGEGCSVHFTLPRKAAEVTHIHGSELERLTRLLGDD